MLEIIAGLSVGYAALGGIVSLVILFGIWSLKNPAVNMPPGPMGYPFVGNLMELSGEPWRDYVKISKKYGPIFSHKLATIQTIVVNNLELVKEGFLKKQVEFAGRPQNIYSWNLISDGGKDIAFGNYSPLWKAQRKIGHSAIKMYANGERLEELLHATYPMIEVLLGKMGTRPFDPKDSLYLIIYNIISSMLFGCKYSMEDKEFQQLMGISRSFSETFGNGLAADVIPGAQYIPTPGLRLIKRLHKEKMEILNRKVREHKEHFDSDNLKDLIDFFLNAQKEAVIKQEDKASKLTDTHVIQMIADGFFAGTTTSIYTMYWAIALMAKHPKIQEKVHTEICALIGDDKYPRLANKKSLPYTSATMREITRYGTVIPLLPHSTTCDTELGGYFIPKDTMVIFNMFALHFDSKEWNGNPEEFEPERFLDLDGRLLPKPAALMPFGAGRRVCLGEIVAKSDFFMLLPSFSNGSRCRLSPVCLCPVQTPWAGQVFLCLGLTQ